MAIARLIAPYDEFRGRDTKRGLNAGNVVYSQGNQRNTRPYSRPFDPRSTLQASQRAFFTLASNTWATLGPSDIASWEALAATITRYNSVGMAYNPAARTLFMQAAMLATSIGFSVVITASLTNTYPVPTALLSVSRNIANDGVLLAFGYAPLPGIIQVKITKPLSPGTRSTKALQFYGPGLASFGFPLSELNIPDTSMGNPGPQEFLDTLFQTPLVSGSRYGFRIQPISSQNLLPGTPVDFIFDVV